MHKIARAFLFFTVIFTLSAKDLSLDEVLKISGANLYWHSLREMGRLSKGEKQIFFLVHSQTIMMGNRIYKGKVYYDSEGKLFFDSKASNDILNYFDEVYVETQKPSNSKHQAAVILIDAGHGGKDPGGIGNHTNFKVVEKDVCLSTAKELEKLLRQAYPHKKIMMVRTGDNFISLEDRVKIANDIVLKEGEGALYISIHTNMAFNKSAKGFEVWHLPASVSREVISDKKLKASGVTQKIINNLINDEYIFEGKKLASFLLEHLSKDFTKITENRGLKEQSWFVIKNSHMAAVLIELGFLSNYEEARRLNDKIYLKKMAKSIYNGVKSFIDYFEKD